MNLECLSLERERVFSWFETLIVKCITELEGKPLKNGKLDYYKQEFFKQYCTHFISIRTLATGLKLIYRGRDSEITALPSVSVLIRASLENYSMFYYIYRDSNGSPDTYFRFWSWFREGLMHRQRLNLMGHVEKLKDEKQEADRILDELREYPSYRSFTPKQSQKYVKDGTWCFSSKRDLLEKAGFSAALASNCYSFFSSYTHPSSTGHLQTSQAGFEASSILMDGMLKPLFICSGLYLHSYSLLFQEISGRMNERDKDLVGSWCELGRKLMQ